MRFAQQCRIGRRRKGALTDYMRVRLRSELAGGYPAIGLVAAGGDFFNQLFLLGAQAPW